VVCVWGVGKGGFEVRLGVGKGGLGWVCWGGVLLGRVGIGLRIRIRVKE